MSTEQKDLLQNTNAEEVLAIGTRLPPIDPELKGHQVDHILAMPDNFDLPRLFVYATESHTDVSSGRKITIWKFVSCTPVSRVVNGDFLQPCIPRGDSLPRSVADQYQPPCALELEL